MGSRFVGLELRDRRASLVLNRPPLNVLNLAMLEELRDALEDVARQKHLKVLVLRGEGKAFSAGVDVADHSEDRAPAMLRLFHEGLLQLYHLDLATIAQVHGPCLGGGLELAMACDLVYATGVATLGHPEIKLASFPPFGAAMYPTLLGSRRAAELILTGRTFSAEEAAAIGLVNAVYGAEQLEDSVAHVCDELEAFSRVALRYAKKAMRQAGMVDPREAVTAAEAVFLKELMATRDAKEGLQAFLEKRKPVWRDE